MPRVAYRGSASVLLVRMQAVAEGHCSPCRASKEVLVAAVSHGVAFGVLAGDVRRNKVEVWKNCGEKRSTSVARLLVSIHNAAESHEGGELLLYDVEWRGAFGRERWEATSH